MALEDLTGSNKFISNLVPVNPADGDDIREGAAHLRGTKNVLINTFPNVNGAVSATDEDLSAAAGGAIAGKVSKAGDSMSGSLVVSGGDIQLVGPHLLYVNGGSAIFERPVDTYNGLAILNAGQSQVSVYSNGAFECGIQGVGPYRFAIGCGGATRLSFDPTTGLGSFTGAVDVPGVGGNISAGGMISAPRVRGDFIPGTAYVTVGPAESTLSFPGIDFYWGGVRQYGLAIVADGTFRFFGDGAINNNLLQLDATTQIVTAPRFEAFGVSRTNTGFRQATTLYEIGAAPAISRGRATLVNGQATVTLPFAYPNPRFFVTINYAGAPALAGVNSVTNSSFVIFGSAWNGTNFVNAADGTVVDWLVIDEQLEAF